MTATPEQDRGDYLGVRHSAPDVIRTMRGALDLGTEPAALRRRFRQLRQRAPEGPERNAAEAVEGALRHLLRDPQAGQVRWTEGGQYVWREDDAPEGNETVMTAEPQQQTQPAQPGLLAALQPEGGIEGGRYRTVPFEQIVPPTADEAVLEDYDLARDIEAKGAVIEPLIMRPAGEGLYRIIAGQRRYLSVAWLRTDGGAPDDEVARAAACRKFKTLPARVFEVDDLQAAVLRVNSNARRRPNPLSDAADVRQLKKAGADATLIHKLTGMLPGTQEKRLRLFDLTPRMRKALRRRKLPSLGLADRIAKLPAEQQEEVWAAYQRRLIEAKQADPPRRTAETLTAADVDAVRRVQKSAAAAADLSADLFAGSRFDEVPAAPAQFLETNPDARGDRQADDLERVMMGNTHGEIRRALRELPEADARAVERLIAQLRPAPNEAVCPEPTCHTPAEEPPGFAPWWEEFRATHSLFHGFRDMAAAAWRAALEGKAS